MLKHLLRLLQEYDIHRHSVWVWLSLELCGVKGGFDLPQHLIRAPVVVEMWFFDRVSGKKRGWSLSSLQYGAFHQRY